MKDLDKLNVQKDKDLRGFGKKPEGEEHEQFFYDLKP